MNLPVKLIAALFAFTLSAHASTSDPGTAAVDFLEKVRVGKLDLEPGGDTALSAQTAEGKKREIAKRLDRVARDLGSDPLEIGAVKEDENFAAVLVRKTGGFDPGRMQIFPVALVKKGAEWIAAPVPASFENAGAGYAIGLRKRLESLEDWMLQGQVDDLQKLREQSTARMREKIGAHFPVEKLRKMDSRQVAEEFAVACGNRDLPTVLALLGGLSTNLPDDWAVRLRAAERAIKAGTVAVRPWRLLISPQIVRVTALHEQHDNKGEVSFFCLDPTGKDVEEGGSVLHAMHLDLSKDTDGLWRLNPSTDFLLENDEPVDDSDADLLTDFAAKFSESHPSVPQSNAADLQARFIAALQGQALEQLLRLLNLDGPPDMATDTCLLASQLWWSVHDPAAVSHAMPLAFKAEENAAIFILQIFSARNPDRMDTKAVYFEKSPGGWLWVPEPDDDIVEEFRGWAETETEGWKDKWQQKLFEEIPVLAKDAALQAPTEDEARKCAMSWLAAVRSGDINAALSQVAMLSDPKSGSTALQNIGYEIIGSRRSERDPEITGIYQGVSWTAVGMKTDQDGKADYPLYPIVNTDKGPRILIEIDLFACGNRSREFLNKAALERLRKATSDGAADDLDKLKAAHVLKSESLLLKRAAK